MSQLVLPIGSREVVAIGFTGTQKGMSWRQIAGIKVALSKLRPARVVHGDCTGADYEFDTICELEGLRREIYPSNIEAKRAHCERRGAVVRAPPQKPLVRNRAMAALGLDVWIAAPSQEHEILRSGTWATVRAVKGKCRIYLLPPDAEGRWI